MTVSDIIWFLIMFVIFVIIFIKIFVKNRKKEHNQDNFKQSMRMIFSYIFLILSLFSMVIGVVYITDSLLDYFLPNEVVQVVDNKAEKSFKQVKSNNLMVELDLQNEKNTAIVNLYTSIATVATSVPVFVYFSKQVKNKKEKQ